MILLQSIKKLMHLNNSNKSNLHLNKNYQINFIYKINLPILFINLSFRDDTISIYHIIINLYFINFFHQISKKLSYFLNKCVNIAFIHQSYVNYYYENSIEYFQ